MLAKISACDDGRVEWQWQVTLLCFIDIINATDYNLTTYEDNKIHCLRWQPILAQVPTCWCGQVNGLGRLRL